VLSRVALPPNPSDFFGAGPLGPPFEDSGAGVLPSTLQSARRMTARRLC
jgi:hypothetical protein